MKEIIYKIFYYLGIPLIITGLLIAFIYNKLYDFEKAVNITATIIQTLAIFIGGVWAYHKFAWDKKAESAIKLKAMLMDYAHQHSFAASQYRINIQEGIKEEDAYLKYATTMLNPYTQLRSHIHLSIHIPKKLRKKIFDTIWLTLGNDHGPKREHLNDNWKKFGQGIKEIQEDLEKLVTK
ncbi:MAG: hypothetical protein WC465_03145 [Patescibacteria group bacterium]